MLIINQVIWECQKSVDFFWFEPVGVAEFSNDSPYSLWIIPSPKLRKPECQDLMGSSLASALVEQVEECARVWSDQYRDELLQLG